MFKRTYVHGNPTIFQGKTTIFHGKTTIFHGKTQRSLHFSQQFAAPKVTEDGSAPVHLAAHFGHRTALRQLLLARCAADLARRDGVTALHLAAEAGHLEMVKMLLEAEGMG